MSFSLDEDVTSNLSTLGKKGKTIRNKALRAGREVLIHNLEENTPYENQSDRSWKGQREMDRITGHKTTFKHLKDDIVYSGIDQTGAIKIGFGKDTYWRVHFVELGTKRQAPNPFITNTLNQSQEQYRNIIEKTVREELGL